MKLMHALSFAGAAALGLTAVASAGAYDPALDYTISINDGNTFQVTGTAVTFFVDVPALTGTVMGFSFVGTVWSDQAGFPSVPRQTQLTITAPDSSMYVIGGDPPSGAPWDFQSASGTNNVTYHHGLGGEAWGGDGLPDFGLPDGPAEGTWAFTFQRVGGFPATFEWSDVAITLHSIPAPGALALLGLAGLAGVRRRRA